MLLAFSERILARAVGERERDAELLARSLQLIAASCELLRQPVWRAPHKLAHNTGSPGASMAGSGSAERETRQRQ